MHQHRTVPGNSGNKSAPHQIDNNRPQPGLDYVAANAPDDRLVQPAGTSYLDRQLAESLDRKDLGQRVEVVTERGAFSDGLAKVRDRHLALARSERIGVDLIQTDGLEIFVNRHEFGARASCPYSARNVGEPSLTRGLVTPLFRKYVCFDQLTNNMADQVVRLLRHRPTANQQIFNAVGA